MIYEGKHSLLGILINSTDYDAVVEKVAEAVQNCQPLTVSALAVHGVMTGVLDAVHGCRLNQLDMVVPDGQPVRWALNWLYGCRMQDRVYGPTLMLKVCDYAAKLGIPIALYGSKPDVIAQLSINLQQQFPALKINDQQPSRFRKVTPVEQLEIVDQIRKSGAKIVFVGLGCPRQEVWLYENRELIGIPAIAVGAAFDFHSGRLPQAPQWLQRSGLEWFFRLVKEPRRLWRRYAYLNPLFLLLLVSQKLNIRSFKPTLCRRVEPVSLYFG